MLGEDEHSLEKLFEALGTILKPESIYIWLMTPVPVFDNRKPIVLIQNGETDKIWQMIYQIVGGIPS